MNAPILRTTGIPAEEFLVELEKHGRAIIEIVFKYIGIRPIDLEICGSRANDGALLSSDLDLGMPMKDWNEQVIFCRAYYGSSPLNVEIFHLNRKFAERYGLSKVDFNPQVPDNKTSCYEHGYSVYSVFERKSYGKILDTNKFHYPYNPRVFSYVPQQYDVKGTPVVSYREVRVLADPVPFSDDEWPKEEVERCRKIYGKTFIEYVVRPKLGGGTELIQK